MDKFYHASEEENFAKVRQMQANEFACLKCFNFFRAF